jgi:hypothetical protein
MQLTLYIDLAAEDCSKSAEFWLVSTNPFSQVSVVQSADACSKST